MLTAWLAVCLIGLSGCDNADEARKPSASQMQVSFNGDIFGTFYQVVIAEGLDSGRQEELEQGMLDEMHEVDDQMSTWRDDSELSMLNQTPIGEWQSISEELMQVLELSQQVNQLSGGAFDITIGSLVNLWSFGPEARPEQVPDQAVLEKRLATVGMDALELDPDNLRVRRLRDVYVDLSGIAKGFATDQVAAYLDRHGIENYLVNLGGEVKVKGHRDGVSRPWRIGIEVPSDTMQPQAEHIIGLEDISIATSGDYRHYFEQDGRRYSHTLDPRTGRPITHRLASVSVIHPSNAMADALATALTVLGEEHGMAMAIRDDIAVVMLVRSNDGWDSRVSPAFVERFGQKMVDSLGLKVMSSQGRGR